MVCVATHNPGKWPYIARCVKHRRHRGLHADQFGNTWESTPEDAAFDKQTEGEK